MKRTCTVLVLAVLLCFGTVVVYAQDATNGADLYEANCAVCHGDSGEGITGPSLINCSICDALQDLIDKIEADMPQGNPENCVTECAEDTAAFVFEIFNDNIPLDDPIPASITAGAVRIELETLATGLAAPIEIKPAGDGSDRLFVVDQTGMIYLLAAGQLQTTPFLDVSSRLVSPLGVLGSRDEADYDERGLLGLAFHPGFADADSSGYGKLYTYTSEPVNGAADFSTTALPEGAGFDHQSVIAEWTADASDPDIVDPTSRREIMRIDQPQFNHNGGMLAFGGDGYLYIGLGDGGSSNDRDDGHGDEGNGQNTATVHGSILRIDPLAPAATADSADAVSANGNYRIPAGNPLVGADGIDEIYAYGFRNPYRFSFDGVTSELIAADVGQNYIEEINNVAAGENYGWNLKEGSFRFIPETGNVSDNVADLPAGLTDPVAQYDHDEGISIIGGYVYRGEALSDLPGKYVFGDFSTSFSEADGRLFYADLAGGVIQEFIIGSDARSLNLYVKGIGIDAAGEIYVLAGSSFGPFGTGGVIFKIVPLPADGGDASSDCFIMTALH